MADNGIISSFSIDGGGLGTITDATSHYFGGYYHVRIIIRADIPVLASCFEQQADYYAALKRFGSTVTFTRTLEKMAVIFEEIETSRQALLVSFNANVLPYIMKAGFADSFVRSEYCKRPKQGPLFSDR